MEKNSESKNKNKKQKKDKKDKKKNKAKTTDKSPPTPKIIVKDENELSHAVMTNKPFTLDASFTRLSMPPAPHLDLLPIIEELALNNTVKELSFGLWKWTQTDLRWLVECLSTHNTGITKITLQNPDFKLEFVEALSQILSTNTHIKTAEISGTSYSFYEDGWALFCKGMAEYGLEELLVSDCVNGPRLQRLCESLRFTKSLKKFALTSDTLNGPVCDSLCNALIANPTITDLCFYSSISNLIKFKEVVQANSIKKLTLMGIDLTAGNLKQMSEELKNNTSITDLTLSYNTVAWEVLGDILQHNRTIVRLNIDGSLLHPVQFPLLNLGSNTTLKELSMFGCQYPDYYVVFSDLGKNTSIKRLTLGKRFMERDLKDKALRQYIAQNQSITELKINSEEYSITNDVLKAVTDGLKVNRTITKLSLKMVAAEYETFKNFVEVILLENNKVLELELLQAKLSSIRVNNAPLNVHGIDNLVLDLVTKNKTLRHITGAEDYPLIEQKLKSNRNTQDKIISDTCTLIKMIVMKPDAFILPIEIWLKIFSYVSYGFSSVDFEQFFHPSMEKGV